MIRYVSVGAVSAYEIGVFSPDICATALRACDASLFERARRVAVRVALPYQRMPYGVWCPMARAAKMLRVPLRTLQHRASKREDLAYRPKDARERIVFVVAVKTRKRRNR